MIHRIRHSPYRSFLWGAMAAFLLNLSVDAPDPAGRHLPEDLSHNEQESLLEFAIEKLLGYEDAFAEYDDDDSDEILTKLTVSVDATLPTALAVVLHTPVPRARRTAYPPYTDRWAAGHHRIDAPPPRT
ncbi:hypothetical protein CLV84_0090 [Neolewinella xylanilytica]|uniref:Uncharacterized protein n=1 Tax=Neolewinella xylanilytica TaxID=1514080 RepID=A0A2S6I6M8_9BACT|nr:hypothetical protein [Neolewinella xylanilytica]PPK87156.1 hypothetical protein CLV84_0090 [Neolewinella xylanilytica]